MTTMTKNKKETLTGVALRDYQVKDNEMIDEAFEKYRSVLYQLPTGGGKGVIITHRISKHSNAETIVFAHKRKLLKQIHKNLAKIGIKAGLIMGMTEENTDAKILLVSIRSAVKQKRLEGLLKRDWKNVYIDEARHSRTGSYDIVLDKLFVLHPKHKLFGVDATPYRKDKKRLDKHFQCLVTSSEDIQSLQKKGFLANIRTFATPIGEIKEQVKEVANDYQITALSNYMRQPKFLNYVVDSYIKFGESRQAIVFAVDKAHSKDLLKVFQEKLVGKNIKQIDSDLSDAEIDIVYAQYENKEIDILINVEMLTEGVDLPETGCIVGARPTKSITLYLQMGGRGTRPKEDGTDLILIDCAGWTEEFGTLNSPREWSLDPEVDPNDKRKKNRIVGKDKNGKLTTDIKQMDEFTELIEMTPEEYVSKVQGGIQEAEKQNQTIDEKIAEVKAEMEKILHEQSVKGLRSKVSPYCSFVRIDEYSKELTAYFFHKERYQKKKARRTDEDIDAWMDYTHVVEMKINKDKNKIFAFLDTDTIENNDWRRRSDQEQSMKEFREMTDVCASLNQTVLNDKSSMMQVIEKRQIIHDLEKSKINIDELKDLQKKYENEKWNEAVAAHCKTGKPFILKEPQRMDNHFKGYDSDRIYEVTVLNDNITAYHNKILLGKKYYSDGKLITVEKNYTKGEKIYELLKDGKWEAPK